MSAFVELKSTWENKKKEYGIETLIAEKFSVLVQDETEDGVSSCFQLLLSFGNEGICEVLEEVEGQVLLREDMGIVHTLLWKQEFLSFVSEGNVWTPLWEGGSFDKMEWDVLGTLEWSGLSERQKGIVIKESKRMVQIPGGTFLMGALPDDADAIDSEKPQHEVTLTKNVEMSVYECTQGLYESVMGTNPSRFKGSNLPVEQVSWCDVVLFCNKLSEMEGLEPVYDIPEGLEDAIQNGDDDTEDGLSKKVKWNHNANGYRLPTEAEWEYCARGGEYHLYAGSNNIDEVAWYNENSGIKMHPVGQKKPNGYGLYDMCGNLFEWVWDPIVLDSSYDFTGASTYSSSAQTDPTIDTSSSSRVLRGGGWGSIARSLRVSFRGDSAPAYPSYSLGFRFCRTP